MKKANWFNGAKFETIILIVTFILIINLVQSPHLFQSLDDSRRILALLLANLLLIAVFSSFLFYKTYKRQGLLYKMFLLFIHSKIPKGAKIAIVLVFSGNLLSIIIGKPLYPFYDVGMFRWNTSFENKSPIVQKPKYFYYQNGHPKILDVRKEGFYFLSEHLGFGYTHEFTFAATFHNKGQKKNFEFLSIVLNENGVDTLWVGVHSVDYRTGKVWFETDICKAITINQKPDLHYGPIYIPEYQLDKCNER